MEIVSAGIPTLDRMLGGGLPHRSVTVITGEPGSGKTILCSQIAFAHAARGRRVVIATVASESTDKLVNDLRGFRFFDEKRVGQEIFLLSLYPWVKKSGKEAREVLLKTMRERDARTLVIDGLRALRDLWQDEARLRDFLYELNVGLAQIGAIGLITTEYPLNQLMGYPEATTVDGILSLSTRRANGCASRRAQVVKLRGRAHLSGEHVMHIESGGIRLVPRLEEITAARADLPPSVARKTFGLRELDTILGGGLPEATTTLLAGTTGIGKSLVALRFAEKGADEGDGAVFVTYSEPPDRLVARSRATGLDVEAPVKSGKLKIVYRAPLEVEGDDLVEEILAEVERLGAKRLVVDGIGELEHRIGDTHRARSLFNALIVQLRNAGVTTIFIKEIPKITGADLDFVDAPIAVAAENLVFARHVELRGRLHRIISVLKMRDSAHDEYLREFTISREGIRVLEPMDSAEGLLAGVARPLHSNR